MTDDEFPDPETELAFLDFLATEWPNWRHHVGSDHWHIRRRSFLAGRPAPQALAATPALEPGAFLNDGTKIIPRPNLHPFYDQLEEAATPADVLERIAREQFSDPAKDDLTVPLAIELSGMTTRAFKAEAALRAATPAVGGEEQEPPSALDLALDRESALAAQPASPLRGREITDAMVNAAAREMWNDRDARHGGGWDTRDPREVCVIQTKATAKAALKAALSASPPEQPEFQRTNPLDTRLSPIEPFTGNYKGTKE